MTTDSAQGEGFFNEVHALATASLEGTLTEQQAVRLETLVRDEPAARQLLARYLLASASLHSWAAAHGAALGAGLRPDDSDGAEGPPVALPMLDHRHRPLRFAAVVMLSTAALWLIFFLAIFYAPAGHQPATARRSAATPQVVARLTGEHDCRWAEAFRPGAQLTAGQVLELEAGLAEITFQGGARVVLQAPAAVALRSPRSATLRSGRLAARVNEAAQGFAVSTPTLNVVDRGTEFGVEVGQQGQARVVVFEGLVEVTRRPATGQPPRQERFEAGESLEVGPKQWRIGTISAADQHRFARRLPIRPDRPLPEQVVPVTAGLELWLAADAGVGRDAQGRVVAWGDLLWAEKQTRHQVWQKSAAQRPRWLPHARQGRPAVRFDGAQWLDTSRFTGGESQTVVAAFARPLRDADPSTLAGPLYHSPGPPTLSMCVSASGIVHAWTYDPRVPRSNGLVRSLPVEAERWHSCTYLYDAGHGVARIYVDGQLHDEAPAAVGAAVEGSKRIGSHPHDGRAFHGDLGELLVYRRALSAAELEEVHRYLHAKFSVVPRASRD